MTKSLGSGDLGIIAEVLEHVQLPFDGQPHQYQIEDVNRGAREKSFGYFLGIGLGKTVVAALTGGYKLLHGYDRCIVSCPASLIEQWGEVLLKMGFDTLLYRGTPQERSRLGFDHDFIVMSFEIFQKDYERIVKYPAYHIVDEATILSNPDNKFFKMFNGSVTKKKVPVPGKLKPDIVTVAYPGVNEGCSLLTATPSNNPAGLYGLIKTLAPEIYVNEFQFNRLHVSEVDYFNAPVGFTNLDMLKSNLESVASIRFSTDHLDLPERVLNVIEYDLDPEHCAIYKELVDTRLVINKDKIVINAIEATTFYNWAQKIIVNPDKASFKKECKGLSILDTIVRGNSQTLIVNKYVMSNQQMMERYKDIGVGGCFGGIPRGQQQQFIKAFQEKRLRVLTVNPKSGGTGLNLQVCHNVVFPEVPVTARDYRQAEGRVYRQGQQNRVIVTLLIARRTIQKTLLKKIMEKDDVMREVIHTPSSLRQDLFPND